MSAPFLVSCYMQLFYSPVVTVPEHQLSEEESRHLIKVLRMHINDRVYITDGGGNLYSAVIIQAHDKRCIVRTSLEDTDTAPFPHLTIVIAMPKKTERFEWFLEKATELGINRIVPIVSQRSERSKPRTDRWLRVIVAAMKQSHRFHLPQLDVPISFEDMINIPWPETTGKFIAHCLDTPRENVWDAIIRGKDAVIAIGPEGDFTEKEVEMATAKGWIPINLDEYRLRTETAAISCVHGYRWLHKTLLQRE